MVVEDPKETNLQILRGPANLRLLFSQTFSLNKYTRPSFSPLPTQMCTLCYVLASLQLSNAAALPTSLMPSYWLTEQNPMYLVMVCLYNVTLDIVVVAKSTVHQLEHGAAWLVLVSVVLQVWSTYLLNSEGEPI